jgi:acid phosphatase (class A)
MLRVNRILSLRVLLLGLLLLLPQSGLAGQERYAGLDQLDLSQLLAPPPAADSARQKKEIAELLALQAKRTPAQAAFAKADEERSLIRFGIMFGPGFTADKLPNAVAFFEKVNKQGDELTQAVKKLWGRPRPFVTNPAITPCVTKPSSASYPSGHTVFATVTGVLLANMVPEKRAEIFERAHQFGLNRMIGGVHYPSDVAAGRVAGTVIAAFLMQDAEFKAEFDRAKAEIRGVLGLH